MSPEEFDALFSLLVDYADHYFFQVIFACCLYFMGKYSYLRNKSGNQLTWAQFRHDEKDDFWFVLGVGFAIIIWDEECLELYNVFSSHEYTEFKGWMYFMPGPAVNFIWSIPSMFFHKK